MGEVLYVWMPCRWGTWRGLVGGEVLWVGMSYGWEGLVGGDAL